MAERDTHTTQQAILDAGKQEFLEFGFERASLRVIARRAGVTTGAIYGYYPDKAALFDALVTEPAEELHQRYLHLVEVFEDRSIEDQYHNMEGMSGVEAHTWIDHIYDNFDAFRLVFSCSSGTRWEHYLDTLITIEENSSSLFVDSLKEASIPVRSINPRMMHLLASAYFEAISEVVVHNMPREEAKEYIDLLNEFFVAGWMKLLQAKI